LSTAAEDQKFSIPYLFGASISILMMICCVIFPIFPL